MSLNQTVNRKPGPTFKTIRDKSISAINNLQVELQRNNLSEQLDKKIDADPELNYNTLIKHICQSVHKCLPQKSVKFNKHKHKKSKWITNEIVRSIASRDRLYAKLKRNSLNSKEKNKLKSNLKTCNALRSKRIREAKKIHYHSCFNKCRHDIKKQRSTIKDILNKPNKNNKFPDFLNINDQKVSESNKIADSFNDFFTNIGTKLSSEIKSSNIQTFSKTSLSIRL